MIRVSKRAQSLKGCKKAQSTLEYILVLSAIIGIIIYAAANWLKPAVEQAFTDVGGSMETAADNLPFAP